MKETAPTLMEAEVATLGNSCFTLACELSTRFLDDYITGDKYFKINYPQHNVVRTRCQIAPGEGYAEEDGCHERHCAGLLGKV